LVRSSRRRGGDGEPLLLLLLNNMERGLGRRQGGRGRARVIAAVRAAHVAQDEPTHADGRRVGERRGARAREVQEGAAVEGPGDVGGRVNDLGDDAAQLDRAPGLDVDVGAPRDVHLGLSRTIYLMILRKRTENCWPKHSWLKTVL